MSKSMLVPYIKILAVRIIQRTSLCYPSGHNHVIMKEIKLSGRAGNGRSTQVLDEDYEWLNQYKWNAATQHGITYVTSTLTISKGIQKTVSMHRLIMQVTDPKVFIDHIDGNGLNNQRSNLRECTRAQNCANRIANRNKQSSKYLGVTIHKGRWLAQIQKNNIPYRKYFITEIDAVKWYNEMAIMLHGEFARPNIIHEDE